MKRKKVKVKKKSIFVVILFIAIIGFGIYYFVTKSEVVEEFKESKKEEEKITDFENLYLSDVIKYAEKNNLEIIKDYDYNESIEKDKVIKGNVEDNKLNLLVSLGSIPVNEFKEKNVNELGKVPIMMYHNIVNVQNKYTGGNVDKDGYNRTSKAFLEDLEFYYKKGYRMIKLKDYIDGNIDVALGYSPIILTFDDGNENNFKVVEKKEDGNLVFDEYSAVGIMEKIKEKYPDMNVTATFFLNGGLCNQKEYNEDIMKWLIKNGYDVGNHTISHVDFTKIGNDKTRFEVGALYQKLDKVIPNEYVKIVALPFGSPYKKTHSNYQFILDGEYEGYQYHTDAALRVGWEPEVSPFDKKFDKTFLKRVRAYDNNGKEFDIEMTFNILEKNKFISDGNKNLITIPKSSESNLNETNLKIITY